MFYHMGVVTLVGIIKTQMKMQKPRRPHDPWDIPAGDAALGPASPGAIHGGAGGVLNLKQQQSRTEQSGWCWEWVCLARWPYGWLTGRVGRGSAYFLPESRSQKTLPTPLCREIASHVCLFCSDLTVTRA